MSEPTTAKERVQKEYDELKDRHNALVGFIGSHAWGHLAEEDQHLLAIQQTIMYAYMQILVQRLKVWK